MKMTPVILSEAKELLFVVGAKKQFLRFAQDDSSATCWEVC
jgi:hypothetical protein